MRDKILTAVVIAFFAFVPSCFGYERVNPRGPMAVRNQLPIYLFYLFAEGQRWLIRQSLHMGPRARHISLP